MEEYDREKHCGFGEPIWDAEDLEKDTSLAVNEK